MDSLGKVIDIGKMIYQRAMEVKGNKEQCQLIAKRVNVCCMLLYVVACCCMLLYFVVFCCILLILFVFCCGIFLCEKRKPAFVEDGQTKVWHPPKRTNTCTNTTHYLKNNSFVCRLVHWGMYILIIHTKISNKLEPLCVPFMPQRNHSGVYWVVQQTFLFIFQRTSYVARRPMRVFQTK